MAKDEFIKMEAPVEWQPKLKIAMDKLFEAFPGATGFVIKRALKDALDILFEIYPSAHTIFVKITPDGQANITFTGKKDEMPINP